MVLITICSVRMILCFRAGDYACDPHPKSTLVCPSELLGMFEPLARANQTESLELGPAGMYFVKNSLKIILPKKFINYKGRASTFRVEKSKHLNHVISGDITNKTHQYRVSPGIML